jgi:hypothetical protein
MFDRMQYLFGTEKLPGSNSNWLNAYEIPENEKNILTI